MGMLGKINGATLDRGDKYQAKKEAERARNAKASKTERDIAAGWPGWGNQYRRRKCRLDLERFLTTYFPEAFQLSVFGRPLQGDSEDRGRRVAWRTVRACHAERVRENDDRNQGHVVGLALRTSALRLLDRSNGEGRLPDA